jgi:hypothetical protein
MVYLNGAAHSLYFISLPMDPYWHRTLLENECEKKIGQMMALSK